MAGHAIPGAHVLAHPDGRAQTGSYCIVHAVGVSASESKCAVQYAACGTAQYFSVHAAMPPGVEREQELQPSNQLLHCASSAGSELAARQEPS